MRAQGKRVLLKTITQSRLQLMLVRRCQPKAVHVSAEPLILSKDTVHSEEIAFYATIAVFVVMCVSVSARQAVRQGAVMTRLRPQFGFVER